MKIVFKGGDYAEAHIVANMLENEGIRTYVGGHFLQGGLGDIGVSNLIDVRVEQQDWVKAKTLIDLYDADSSAKHERKSLGFDKPSSFNKSVIFVMALIFIVVLIAFMFLSF